MSDAPSTEPTPGLVAKPSSSGGNNKTVGIAIAGFVCTIMAWVVKEKLGVEIPPDVSSAIQGLLSIIVVYVIPHSNASGQAN